MSTNYLALYAPKTFQNVQRFRGGHALFTFPTMPIKCPGAPQKIMYLADDYWRKVGFQFLFQLFMLILLCIFCLLIDFTAGENTDSVYFQLLICCLLVDFVVYLLFVYLLIWTTGEQIHSIQFF